MKSNMFKKCLMVLLVSAFALAANAGEWIVHVKMYDDSVLTLELASVPSPDSNGMYRFHFKNLGDVFVHASNVWIVEKPKKSKAKN